MKLAYPIILTPVSDDNYAGYAVYIPTLDIDTQGESVADAISMARDAIGMWACFEIDEGRSVPEPVVRQPISVPADSIMALVDIDIDAYRRAHDTRTVRKNLTIPKWLNDQAETAGINFSQVLQYALKQHLKVDEPEFIFHSPGISYNDNYRSDIKMHSARTAVVAAKKAASGSIRTDASAGTIAVEAPSEREQSKQTQNNSNTNPNNKTKSSKQTTGK